MKHGQRAVRVKVRVRISVRIRVKVWVRVHCTNIAMKLNVLKRCGCFPPPPVGIIVNENFFLIKELNKYNNKIMGQSNIMKYFMKKQLRADS